jgi:hypothetical protein
MTLRSSGTSLRPRTADRENRRAGDKRNNVDRPGPGTTSDPRGPDRQNFGVTVLSDLTPIGVAELPADHLIQRRRVSPLEIDSEE